MDSRPKAQVILLGICDGSTVGDTECLASPRRLPQDYSGHAPRPAHRPRAGLLRRSRPSLRMRCPRMDLLVCRLVTQSCPTLCDPTTVAHQASLSFRDLLTTSYQMHTVQPHCHVPSTRDRSKSGGQVASGFRELLGGTNLLTDTG